MNSLLSLHNQYVNQKKKENSSQTTPNTTQLNKTQKNIIIATPTMDSRLDVFYVDSLVSTIKECLKQNIHVYPIYMKGESILHMSRNQLIKVFYESEADSIVFIDSDQRWDADTFLRVVKSNKPVYGVAVPLKTDDRLTFNVLFDFENGKVDPETKDITLKRIGSGFIKLERKVVEDLWNTSEEISFKEQKMKMVFDYGLDIKRDFIGEDFIFCEKVKDLGYDIWTNLDFISEHMGYKVYSGDIKMYYQEAKKMCKNSNNPNISFTKKVNMTKGFGK